VAYHLEPMAPDQRLELFVDASENEPSPRWHRLLGAALVLVVMALFAGGVWFAYVQGTRHAGGSAAHGEVPLIRADDRPTKVKPERPGGMEIPDQDNLIYNRSRPSVEHLLPPPEKPLPRPTTPPSGQIGSPAPAPATQATAPGATPAPTVAPAGPVAQAPPAAPAHGVQSAAKPGGNRLQLGSVRSEDDARREWDRIKQKNSDLLGSLSATPVRADLGDRGTYYRILTGPVADAATAERICSELKQRNIGCFLAR
jgi:SPOR domain